MSRNAPSMGMARHVLNLKSPRQLKLQALSTMCGTCFLFQCVSVLCVMLGTAWVWWCCNHKALECLCYNALSDGLAPCKHQATLVW
jgi:hypothetical protein